MLGNLPQLETVERLIRAGIYTGPLNLNYVAIGGGASAFHPADLVEFARRSPDGAVLTIESIMRSTLPMNTIAIALGLHVRVGIEDNLWPRKQRITSVQQVEQLVRIAGELGRDIASGEEAHLPHRRVLRGCRRDPGPPRDGIQPAAPVSAASCCARRATAAWSDDRAHPSAAVTGARSRNPRPGYAACP